MPAVWSAPSRRCIEVSRSDACNCRPTERLTCRLFVAAAAAKTDTVVKVFYGNTKISVYRTITVRNDLLCLVGDADKLFVTMGAQFFFLSSYSILFHQNLIALARLLTGNKRDRTESAEWSQFVVVLAQTYLWVCGCYSQWRYHSTQPIPERRCAVF